MVVDTGGIRKGLTLDMNGELYKVTDFGHHKMGRGSAILRMTIKNLRTGSTTQETYQSGTKFQTARLERANVQYLYRDEDLFHFMDNESFEQIVLNEDLLGDAIKFIRENDSVDLLTYQDQPVDIELPITVVLKVADTDPGHKGDTATGGSKPATLETGFIVSVPLFINIGDDVKVDTRTGEYLERVS